MAYICQGIVLSIVLNLNFALAQFGQLCFLHRGINSMQFNLTELDSHVHGMKEIHLVHKLEQSLWIWPHIPVAQWQHCEFSK